MAKRKMIGTLFFALIAEMDLEIKNMIGYSRLFRKIRKQRKPSDADNRLVRHCVERLAELVEKLDTLTF